MADEKISKVNKMKELFEQKSSMKSTSTQRPSTYSMRPKVSSTADLEQEDDSDISMMYIQKRSLVKNRLTNFKDEMTNTPTKPLRKVEIKNVVVINDIEEGDEEDDDLVSMAYIKKKSLVSDRRGQFEKSFIIEEEEAEEDDFSGKIIKSKSSKTEILKADLDESFVSNNMKVEDSIFLAKKRLNILSTPQINKEEKLNLEKITSFEDIDVSLSDDYTISGLLSPSPEVLQKKFNLKPIVEKKVFEIPKEIRPPVAATRKIINTEIEPPKIVPRNEIISETTTLPKNLIEPSVSKDSDDSDNEEFFSMTSVVTGELSTNYEDYSSIAFFVDDRK